MADVMLMNHGGGKSLECLGSVIGGGVGIKTSVFKSDLLVGRDSFVLLAHTNDVFQQGKEMYDRKVLGVVLAGDKIHFVVYSFDQGEIYSAPLDAATYFDKETGEINANTTIISGLFRLDGNPYRETYAIYA